MISPRIIEIRRLYAEAESLISFSATVNGTFIGLLGTLIAIYGTFAEHRGIGIASGLVGFVLFATASYRLGLKALVRRGQK